MRALIGIFAIASTIDAWSHPMPAGAPLSVDEQGGIVIQVAVNGRGPFSFLLDTGTTRSIVVEELQREVAAPLVGRSELVTSTGSAVRAVARLGRVEVAGAHTTSLLATVVPAASLGKIGRGLSGVLGLDFLAPFNFTIDYRTRRLTWDDAATPCDSPSAVRLVPADGRYVVELQSSGRAHGLRLVPDSGAESLVFFSRPGTDTPYGVVVVGRASAGGLVDTRDARAAVASEIVVGDVILRDRPAVIVEAAGFDADGLLPLHMFGSVSFNTRDACLVVRPK